MSFSKKVKKELVGVVDAARHCRLAELAGIIDTCGRIWYEGNTPYRLEILTENALVERKCFTLLKKTFNIDTENMMKQEESPKKSGGYEVRIDSPETAALICRAIKAIRTSSVAVSASAIKAANVAMPVNADMADSAVMSANIGMADGVAMPDAATMPANVGMATGAAMAVNTGMVTSVAMEPDSTKEEREGPGSFEISRLIAQSTCCKRAFIRGAFLGAGSMSDPEKTYHFEVVFSEKGKATQLMEIINSFSIDAKVVARKKYHVVYVKEGSHIADLLNIMGAHVSLMDMENVRILKEVRNSVNRQVNCETANINKTAVAAAKQIDDIIYIRDTIGFDELTEGLEEIAMLRLDYPEASLKELGEMLSAPIGKSGVNHRLKKLSSIAMDLRGLKED